MIKECVLRRSAERSDAQKNYLTILLPALQRRSPKEAKKAALYPAAAGFARTRRRAAPRHQ